jgi:hypothetical protein
VKLRESNATLMEQSTKTLQAFSELQATMNASGHPAQNLTKLAQDMAAAAQWSTIQPWPFFSSWIDSPGEDMSQGTSSLAYFACQGGQTMSMQPLRRVAELTRRCTEWWLFKTVWILSISIISCFFGISWSYSVRAAIFCIFRFWLKVSGNTSGGSEMNERLELVEALVLVLAPIAIYSGMSSLGGDLADDTAQVMLCQAFAEIVALFSMRTQESRYIFPRALLLVYSANTYYMFFHPFGFIRHMHGLLISFQAFLVLVLWSHFEVAVKLPPTCQDQLTVEVRLRPSARPTQSSALSPTMQQLLLEQGLLLLGDDRSHESAVVMSALVIQALQLAKPLPAPLPEGFSLAAEDEEVLVAAVEHAGGAMGQILVDHTRGGNKRCMALVRHLMERLPRSSHMRRNEVLRWLLQHNENDALWVLSAVANARPHLLTEVAPGQFHLPPPVRRVMVLPSGSGLSDITSNLPEPRSMPQPQGPAGSQTGASPRLPVDLPLRPSVAAVDLGLAMRADAQAEARSRQIPPDM